MELDFAFFISAVLTCALLLDYLIGEAKRFHCLVGFGVVATALEKILNGYAKKNTAFNLLLSGCFAWALLIITGLAFYWIVYNILALAILTLFASLDTALIAKFIIDVYVVYWAIGLRSLKEHTLNIYQPLNQGEIESARFRLSYLVSRETRQLAPKDIARAATESLFENGHDAVVASIFWYLVGGAPLVIIHRLSNTLDAMWGYRTCRFNYFGRCSAKIDDFLGWPSAKLTSIIYLFASFKSLQSVYIGLLLAKRQAKRYKSINGGWAISAGATALGVRLGGKAVYHDQVFLGPILGLGKDIRAPQILSAIKLLNFAVLLCLGFVFLIELCIKVYSK
ncbi:cobalamin biosynthesis protein CobD/CbiB [Aliikangiella sp. IMCC44632]